MRWLAFAFRSRTWLATSVAAALFTFATPAIAEKLNVLDGLAIKGYDAVAYFTDGKASAGSAQFSYRWSDIEWRFASAAHRDAFAKDPTKYAPQYGGFCAYAASKGAIADTDPTAFRVVDDRLYLNFSHQVLTQFSADLRGNIGKADANWPRLSQ